MNLYVSFIILLFALCSCEKPEKVDLSTFKLNESIYGLYNATDTALIGVETIEYPYDLILEIKNPGKYSYEGIDLGQNRVLFLINSESLKTDSITRFGGAHYDMSVIASDRKPLQEKLMSYRADTTIYGVRIEMESEELQSTLLSKLETKYGKGTKNPNTDNGLYWNIKADNKFIFFAPDYHRLIILNNTHLSKTCYWDSFNGMIDMGGCDQEKYLQSLVRNATKPEDVKNKPQIKIDKNWNINGLVVGTSTEEDFTKSTLHTGSERMEEYDGTTAAPKEIYYQNKYHDIFFFFSPSKSNPENLKENSLQGYSISDFKKVNVTFDNQLKPGIKRADAIKLFDQTKILNYQDLKISNFLEIDHAPYKITLTFDEKDQISGIFFTKKE
ncbi:hypothetical protein SAMN05660841_02629 [Sphingobacterium nematocida]|uniref:Uncharacterized protein n=1 Tax=Sphingobacterium nematocida TaxID=1513896 RepID=A0A1T5EJQ0_9SPHI|nr:hypothetical protein [Sphingobacterium nematocida]SKB84136.1 hypothetical protein SAMN05660841_02629 [Sphingobacterium nematocida]